MPRKTKEDKLREKEIKKYKKAQQQKDKEREAALEKKRKELLAQQKKNEQIKEKLAQKKDYEIEDAKRVVYIDSTQMCTPVKDVIDSIVLTADSRYLKIIEVKPNNFESMHQSEQNFVSDVFAQMLTIVPYQIQFKCFTRIADVEHQIKDIREEFAAETNSALVEMQEDYLQLVRNTASSVGITRRFFVILQYRQTGQEKNSFNRIRDGFNATANMIKDRLRECGCLVLDTGDTTNGVNSIFYEIVNRRLAEEVPYEEHVNDIIDAYESSEAPLDENGEPIRHYVTTNEAIAPKWMDFTHANYCVIDDKFYRFYFIDSNGYKKVVPAGWLNLFVSAGPGIDMDLFVRHIDVDAVQEKIARNQRLNMAKDNSSSNVDYYAQADKIQSGEFLLQGIATGQNYYEFCVLVTLTADSLEELNHINTYFIQSAKTAQVKVRSCMFQAEKAFYSSLPLCYIDPGIWKKGWRNVLTDGAAGLYPFLSFELQEPKGIMMGVDTRNSSLVLLNLFSSRNHPNANVSIIGKSGYGKTFTSQLIAIRERLQGMQIFIITPMSGMEDYYRICQKIQGQFVAMGPGTKSYINVFDIRASDNTVEIDGTTKSLLDQKIGSLHVFFKLIVSDLSLEEDQVLDSYLYKVYNDRGIVSDDNNSIFIEGTNTYKQFPLLEDVYNEIVNTPELRRVANIIRPYVYGVYSRYNKRTNINLDNKYIVFDMDGAKGATELAVAMFVTLDFVWSKIKENQLQKKAVFIDEIWKLISVDGNDIAAEYCLEIYKTIRKYGGSACCMTQDLNDFFSLKDGKYGKAIIANSDTKICLRLDSDQVKKLREVMELSEDEMSRISKYEKGTGLLATGSSHVEVEFKASPKEKQVLTTNPEDLRKEAAKDEKRKKALEALRNGTQNEKGNP